MVGFKDQTMPSGKWAFDQEVTNVFEDMLERSIPQLSVMRNAVTDLAAAHHQNNTSVVDLGCSRGDAIAPLVNLLRDGASSFHAVEISEPMFRVARERFAHEPKVHVHQIDLRHEYPPAAPASVTLAVLVVQFVPIEHRLRILRKVAETTCEGGALILVEKVLGASHEVNERLVGMHENMKRANGYTDDQIARKKLSLEGVLVPVTASWNEDLLRRSGFRDVDCFWRWANFAGWVAVK
jgi:tRNA (cmo5U34)-methyltransferase